jgi:hypothetical protein
MFELPELDEALCEEAARGDVVRTHRERPLEMVTGGRRIAVPNEQLAGSMKEARERLAGRRSIVG